MVHVPNALRQHLTSTPCPTTGKDICTSGSSQGANQSICISYDPRLGREVCQPAQSIKPAPPIPNRLIRWHRATEVETMQLLSLSRHSRKSQAPLQSARLSRSRCKATRKVQTLRPSLKRALGRPDNLRSNRRVARGADQDVARAAWVSFRSAVRLVALGRSECRGPHHTSCVRWAGPGGPMS